MNTITYGLNRVISCIFPTGRLAIFCGVMFCIELCLLLDSSAKLLAFGGPIPWIVLFWLMWFWLTLSWGVYFVGKFSDRLDQRNRWQGAGIRLFLGMTGGLALLLHVCSWGLYRQIGQFANVEALRFLIVNPPLSIWHDMTVAERIALSIALGVICCGLFFSSRILKFLSHTSDRQHRDLKLESLHSYRRLSWQMMSILLMIPTLIIAADESRMRRSTWIQVVKTRVHPVATLTLSVTERLFLEPILPVLDEDELIPLTAQWSPPEKTGRRPSVIILAVEALRADTVHMQHQGREILPNINRLAKGGVQFTQAYSQSTHSDYADVCIVSSLYPLRTQRHHFYTTDDPWPKSLAFDLFKQAGYSTAIISSQNEGWGNMDQFLQTPYLDLFYDAARSGQKRIPRADDPSFDRDPGFAHEVRIGALSTGKLEDSQTMDRAIDWVTQQVNAEQPFFLSMNFQSSHFPYEVPDSAEQPFQPAELAMDVTFMQYPQKRTPQVRNAYYNGIHHCDFQIGRMIETLEQLQVLDDVILVVLGENGEAFNENGYCGHAQEPVQPMVHVATVIHAPHYLQPGREDYPLEHVDIMPTILGMLDWEPHPNFQGIDLFAEERPPVEERLIFFHVNNCSNVADAVILGGRWKLMHDLHWQRLTLHDLKNDPGETLNVLQEHPELAQTLMRHLQTWRNNQLAYYHFPSYFTRFYPPSKPHWTGVFPETN